MSKKKTPATENAQAAKVLQDEIDLELCVVDLMQLGYSIAAVASQLKLKTTDVIRITNKPEVMARIDEGRRLINKDHFDRAKSVRSAAIDELHRFLSPELGLTNQKLKAIEIVLDRLGATEYRQRTGTELEIVGALTIDDLRTKLKAVDTYNRDTEREVQEDE